MHARLRLRLSVLQKGLTPKVPASLITSSLFKQGIKRAFKRLDQKFCTSFNVLAVFVLNES